MVSNDTPKQFIPISYFSADLLEGDIRLTFFDSTRNNEYQTPNKPIFQTVIQTNGKYTGNMRN
jgi:hypothetical protein